MVDDSTPGLDAVSRLLGRFMDGPLPAMLMVFAMAVGVAALMTGHVSDIPYPA